MRIGLPAIVAAALACALGCLGPGVVTPPSASRPSFDVPRLSGVTVDGKVADWGDGGLRIEVLTCAAGPWRPAADFDVAARLGWDDRGLLVFVAVCDDQPVENDDTTELWRKDSVELFLVPAHGARDLWQIAVAPGLDPKYPKLRAHHYDRRRRAALKAVALTAELARSTAGEGYVLEARLPWACLGIEPRLGREVAFQLYATDVDGPGDHVQYRWFPAGNTHADSRRTRRLRLAERPGPAVVAAATAGYERFRRTRIHVAARAGRRVVVLDGRRTLGEAELARDGLLRTASVAAPMPPRGKPRGPLTVAIDGAPAATVVLPDADAERKRAFERAALRPSPCVFSGERFPAVGFERPSLVEDLIGPYTLETAFYDADHNQVVTAKRPGRYGAVVEIRPQDGPPTRRFLTLFRQPKGLRWRRHKLALTVELPPQLGIHPDVATAHAETLADLFKQGLVGGFDREADAAVVLAGLFETKPGTPPTRRTGPRARNTRWWHVLKRKTGDLVPLRYLVHLPPGAGDDKSKRWPTILFLHGAGERGDNLEHVKLHGPPKIVETRKDFPFIVLSPQCPRGTWWTAPPLEDLLAEAMAKHPIDPDRLYVTGLSMGGFGSWALACEHPGRFAAVVPICGGGDSRDVERIKDLPVWVFHGGADGVVPVSESEEMAAALRKVGGRVRFTVYPAAGHDSWSATYDDPRLYEWLLRQRRGKPEQPRATTQGGTPDEVRGKRPSNAP